MEPCEHLKPVMDLLAEHGIELGEGHSPAPGFTLFYVDCVVEHRSIVKRLGLQKPVEGFEELNWKTGDECGFHCATHGCSIIGRHPRSAASDQARLR